MLKCTKIVRLIWGLDIFFGTCGCVFVLQSLILKMKKKYKSTFGAFIQGTNKVKQHHVEHPFKTQLEGVIDDDAPVDEKLQVASELISTWSNMYS